MLHEFTQGFGRRSPVLSMLGAPDAPVQSAVDACAPHGGIKSYSEPDPFSFDATCNDGMHCFGGAEQETQCRRKIPAPQKTGGGPLGPVMRTLIAHTPGPSADADKWAEMQATIADCQKDLSSHPECAKLADACKRSTPEEDGGVCIGKLAPGAADGEKPAETESKLGLYVGIGVAAVAALGGIAYLATRGGGRAGNPAKADPIVADAKIDWGAAKAFSDAWSPELRAAMRHQKHPARDLDFRSKKWLSLTQVSRLMRAICPTYNEFDVDVFEDGMREIARLSLDCPENALEFQVAREGSPAIYMRSANIKRVTDSKLMHTFDPNIPYSARRIMERIRADEMHIEQEHPAIIRFWWD